MSASLLSRAAPALKAAWLGDLSPERGCAFAPLGAELARESPAARRALTARLEALLALLPEHVRIGAASRAAAGRWPSCLVSSAP